MRKIKLQMQLSLDGFVCGLDGQMDWMVWNWDDILKNYVAGLTNSVDTFFVGPLHRRGNGCLLANRCQ